MIDFRIKKVESFNRKETPLPNETIYDDCIFNLPNILSLDIYYRTPEQCPFNRGNWVTDIVYTDHTAIAFKLPKDMPREAVVAFYQPLINDLEKYRNSQLKDGKYERYQEGTDD